MLFCVCIVLLGFSIVVKCAACAWVEDLLTSRKVVLNIKNNYFGHAMDVTKPYYDMPNKLDKV